MRLIGLNGRLHSGKDSAVEFIRKVADGDVERVGFADRLKTSGVLALGFEPESIEEAIEIANDIKENCWVEVYRDDGDYPTEAEVSGREFWQLYGTESHRNIFGQDFWVDALLPSVERPPRLATSGQALRNRFPGVDVLVITDVRFPNEAERIRALGGEVWYIDADERLGPLPEDAHISEHPLPAHLITRTVDNNKSLRDYEYQVGKAYRAATR